MRKLEAGNLAILLEDLVDWFFSTKEAEGVSPNTVKEYTKSFRYFATWLGERRPLDLTSSDLSAFLLWLRKRTPLANTLCPAC